MTATDISPIFPVSNLAAALDHYSKLGFVTHSHDSRYGFARLDSCHIHLTEVDDLDPLTSNSAAYLYVDDADALLALWQAAAVGGRMHQTEDTDYGLREGAHVDPDGNLIRFGSPPS